MNSPDSSNDKKQAEIMPPQLPPQLSSSTSYSVDKTVNAPPPILKGKKSTASDGSAENEKLYDFEDEENFDDFPLTRRNRPEAEMDMTPMVDVVFLLLIFFMITAAFGMQKSIEIPDPENDQSGRQSKQVESKEENNILVHITEEDRVFVEGEEATTQQELYSKLREQMYLGGGRQARQLLVLAEAKATHGQIVRVLDAASGVGMDSVRLKTE